MRQTWSKEEQEYIRRKIVDEHVHPRDFLDELERKFGVKRSVDSVTSFFRRQFGEPVGRYVKLSSTDDEAESGGDVSKLIELEKRKWRQKAEQARLRDELRRAAQVSALIEAIHEAAAMLEPMRIELPQPPPPDEHEWSEEEVVLLISDVHAGSYVDTRVTGGIGGYSTEHFDRYVETLKEKVRTIARIHRKAVPIRKCHLWFLGDIVDNEGMRESAKLHVDKKLVDAFFYAAQKLAEFIIELAAQFESLEVTGVIGNHGRIGKRDHEWLMNNFDYFIYQFIAERVKAALGDGSADRVHFDIPYSFWTVRRVLGWRFFLTHGDTILSWLGIPYYGINRAESQWQGILKQEAMSASEDRAALLRRLESIYRDVKDGVKDYHDVLSEFTQGFEYLVLGHFHRPANWQNPGAEIIMNGAWQGATEYSLRKLKVAIRPSQTMFGVHREVGVTWLRRIYLDKASAAR